ncbi:MAG TPA: two-component regulator propeller domain-containing protein [Chitinimonas sp.]
MTLALPARRLIAQLGATLLTCCLSVVLWAATATTPQRSLLANFHHTAWTVQQGAPADIWALAQTRDGWLWIGSSSGLYRFDGVRFERVEAFGGQKLLSSNILSLLATDDGSLWIGYRFGGISRARAGALRHYTEQDGLPKFSIMDIASAPDGTVWAATAKDLAYLTDERWHRLARGSGLPDDVMNQIVVDYPAGLAVATRGSGVYLRPPGAAQFHHLNLGSSPASLLHAPDQSLLAVNDAEGLFRYSDARRRFTPLIVPRERFERSKLLMDREGALWSAGGGFLRRTLLNTRNQDSYTLSQAQGLSGAYVQALLEDSEGTVWIGTSGGLDRLRRNRLVSVPLDTELYQPGITRGELGAVWVGGVPSVVDIKPDDLPQRPLPISTTALYTDPANVAWVGSARGIWRMEGKDRHLVAFPEELRDGEVQAISRDGQGGLWVAISGKRQGLYRHDGEQWQRKGRYDALPDGTPLAIQLDGLDQLWFGYSGNRIARLSGGKVTLFSSLDGLELGNVLSLHGRGRQLWAGGENGLAVYNGERFMPVRGVLGERFLGTSGMVATAEGDLWLHGTEGISRLGAQEIQTLLKQPDHLLQYERFNFQDGLTGSASQIRPLPSLIEASDKRIWYATSVAVGWLDPHHIPRNNRAPPVEITGLQVDGQRYPLENGLVLPKGSSKLRIEFTALSLRVPERVRFRYQLQGVDKGWQEGQGLREAVYTNLAPGQYRFTVTAANEDGVWSEKAATLSFEAKPRLTQTGWFAALCAFLLLALLVLLFRLRMRQVSRRIKDRAQERLIEREKLARAVNDTLLQGMQGLMLRIQGAQRYCDEDAGKAQDMIQEVLDQADALMAESREQITALRAVIEFADGVPRALGEIGTMLSHEHGVFFRLLTEGEQRDIRCEVRDEIYQIGREALFNAFRHAKARKVELELLYGRDFLQLRVGDDGCGIDPTQIQAERRPGHWGIAGMRERAEQIGAELDFWSQPGNGTEVVLKVPAELAYTPKKRRFWPTRPETEAERSTES